MSLPRLLRACIAPVLFSAAGLAAQGTPAGAASCAGGAADSVGMRIDFTLPVTPAAAAAALDSALRAQGYAGAVADSTGAWSVEPRHTWLAAHAEAGWRGPEHPGVQLSGSIRPRGDSTEFALLARTLCSSGRAPDPRWLGTADELLERLSALELMREVVRRSGWQPDAPSLQVPTVIAGHMLSMQVSHEGRTTLSYRAPDGRRELHMILEGGLVPSARCTPACADVEVQKVVAGITNPAERRVMETLVPGAGDRWRAGIRITIVATQPGHLLHYNAFAFPGHVVRFTGIVPDTPAGAALMQAFISDALANGAAGAEASPR